MCRVVNKYKEPYTVYIGRGSKWGNPYSHKSGTKVLYRVNCRQESIEMFKKYLWNEIKCGRITLQDLLSLDGEVLGCYCKPQNCHGDVIVKAVEWAKRVSK
jgi:hypothetical protein